MPKGLPVPVGINDLRGDVKDGVIFISFSIPTKNMDGTPVKDLAGFRILKSCGGCGGGFDLWKNIHLTDKQGYTIQNNRLYTYDNDLRAGFDYGYRVYPYSTKDVQGEASNIVSLRWVKPPAPPKQVRAEEGDMRDHPVVGQGRWPLLQRVPMGRQSLSPLPSQPRAPDRLPVHRIEAAERGDITSMKFGR